MAGREKIKCYQYDSNGKYLNTYNSIAELREKYFNNYKGKVPLFRDDSYEVLPDNTVVTLERLGRDNVVNLLRIHYNPLVQKRNSNFDNRPIEVYDIIGNKIGEFKDKECARILLGLSKNMINSYLRNTGKNLPKNKLGIRIKYKE